jgi:DMSO/TMAO reductase YedYZ molybdopterin-dependent catalytic subunit
MVELIKLVRPKAEAKAVVFYSFGEGLEGGQFYDSHTIENVRHCQTILAYEMNFELLNPGSRRTAAPASREPARLQDGVCGLRWGCGLNRSSSSIA